MRISDWSSDVCSSDLEKTSYYGSQLSFAARIEPVVPPSMIYVTESFAAQVAIEAPDDFMLDYAGEVEFAKQFGTYRLYSLRQRYRRLSSRSEEHTSELQSLMRISYAVFCLKKKK